MESVGKKPRRQRRAFTPEFKAEIVELCQRGDRSVGQVARDFDLTETVVREWVRQAGRDAGTRQDGGLTSAEHRELAQLRAENRRLREDVEILKRATAFLALRRPGELLPVHRGGESAAAQVKRACELLKVSRAAYYAARDGRPSDRDRQDAELTTRITAEHKRSRGRYGGAADPCRAAPPGPQPPPQADCPADACGTRPGSKPRLAWLRDCSDHKGVSLFLVLVLVGAGADIWWRVGHAKWGLVRKVVFWVALVAVLWVLVNYYSVPHPEV